MSSDPVVFLRQALDQAEGLARATTVYQPYDEWDAVGVADDDDIGRSCWEVVLIARPAVRSPSARSLMQHIAANDPAAVLRRVAADRKILEAHHRSGKSCPRCSLGAEDGRVVYELDPCETLRLLAAGWGWEEE